MDKKVLSAAAEPTQTKLRIVLVDADAAPKRRPVLVASSESELPVLPLVVEEVASPSAVRGKGKSTPRSINRSRLGLGEVAADQFAVIARQRMAEFDEKMKSARDLVAFMRREAELLYIISECKDSLFDLLVEAAQLDIHSRTYATLLHLLGTSEWELKQLELVFWMHNTVCPGEEPLALSREACPQSRGTRIAEIFHREAAIIETEHGRDVISERNIPVVRIKSASPGEIETPSFPDHHIIYPIGQTYGENAFVQFPNDENACQMILEDGDASSWVQLMEKGMYARMRREDEGWIYCPTLSNFSVLTPERFVGSTKKLIACDQVVAPPPHEDTTQKFLDAWVENAKFTSESP